MPSVVDASAFHGSLFHTIIQSDSVTSLTVDLQGSRFVIPPKAKFIMSGVDGLSRYAKQCENKFDFIVVDPPWENKSVKRKRT